MRPLNLTEYLLIQIAASLTEKPAEKLYEGYEEQRAKRVRDASPIDEDDVLAIYAAYPARDPSNQNRSLCKCAKDKQRIRLLLRMYTKEELLQAIESEIKENIDTGKWLKNFSTFLNNIPDLGGEPTESKSIYEK